MSSSTSSTDSVTGAYESDYFLNEFPALNSSNPRPKKRCHIIPNYRWTESTVRALLDATLENLKNFEQPTARVYYCNLKNNYNKLSELDWNKIKHKMRNLRVQYTNATKWQLEHGIDETEQHIKKNILKLCPYWDYCDKIFKHKLTNIDLSDQMFKEGSKSNDSSVDSFCYKRNEVKNIEPKPEPIKVKPTRTKSLNQVVIKNENHVFAETENCAPFENHFVHPEKEVSNNNYMEEGKSQIENSLEFQKEKFEVDTEIEREKLQLQRENLILEQAKLELEKSKIDLEKYKIDADFKLKQEQIASDERIRKYEIELKYRV